MEKVIAKLDTIHSQLLDAIIGIDEARFSRRPSPGEWSIAEVVHHLYLVEKRVLVDLEEKLKAPPNGMSSFRRLFQPPAWIASMRTFRVKAPKFVEPLNPPAKQEVIDNFNQTRANIKNLLNNNGRSRLLQITVKHPI